MCERDEGIQQYIIKNWLNANNAGIFILAKMQNHPEKNFDDTKRNEILGRYRELEENKKQCMYK